MSAAVTVFTALLVSVDAAGNGSKGLKVALATLAAVEAQGTPEAYAVLADLVRRINEVEEKANDHTHP